MRSKFIVAALATSFSFLTTAAGSGILTLKGRLKSFNDSSLTIETAANRYVVNMTELSQETLTYLKLKRTGEPVELTVSTEAIKSVDALSAAIK